MTSGLIVTYIAIHPNLEVTVIIGGEVDGLLEIPTTAVETYSPDCGMFDAGLPPIPVARKLLGATYLDGL
jgi:hypothetical protein